MYEGSAFSLTFEKLTWGKRLSEDPNGAIKVLSGDWVTFSWHLGFHPLQSGCPAWQLAPFPPYRGSWPRAWSSSPVWQVVCDFWLPPLYSSGVCNSNLTVISITLKPSECSLYRHLNICQIVFSSLQLQIRRSCIECEKWKSKGLISKQWYFDQHSHRRKALYYWICQTVVGNTAVQFKHALESKLDTIL